MASKRRCRLFFGVTGLHHSCGDLSDYGRSLQASRSQGNTVFCGIHHTCGIFTSKWDHSSYCSTDILIPFSFKSTLSRHLTVAKVVTDRSFVGPQRFGRTTATSTGSQQQPPHRLFNSKIRTERCFTKTWHDSKDIQYLHKYNSALRYIPTCPRTRDERICLMGASLLERN